MTVKPANNNKKILIGIIIAAITAGIAFYFSYWTKTPSYTLNLIQKAVEKHDLSAFEKHVDLQTIYTHAFDDYIAAELDKQEQNPNQQIMAQTIEKLKENLIPIMIEETKQNIKPENQEQKHQITEDEIGVKKAQKIIKTKTGMYTLEFKGVKDTIIEGKDALLSINVYDKKLQETFTLNLKMHELGDGTWRINQITNLKEFVQTRKIQTRKKLDELNAENIKKINEIIQIKDENEETLSVGLTKAGGWFPTYYVYTNLNIQEKTSDKKIKCGICTLEIYDQNDKELFKGRFQFSKNRPRDTLVIANASWELNQFIPRQKRLIENFTDIKYKIYISALTLTDDTEIKLLDEIPE